MSKSRSKTFPKDEADTKPRFPGPATMAMILGLIVVAGWKILMPPKVTIERRVAASGQSHSERSVSLSQLLSWSAELELTKSQRQSLAKLSEEQKAKLAPVMNGITKAVREFNEFAERHNRDGASLTELQEKGTRMSVLSKQKREIEREFAQEGLASLTHEQQEKVRALWRAKQVPLKARVNEVASP